MHISTTKYIAQIESKSQSYACALHCAIFYIFCICKSLSSILAEKLHSTLTELQSPMPQNVDNNKLLLE